MILIAPARSRRHPIVAHAYVVPIVRELASPPPAVGEQRAW